MTPHQLLQYHDAGQLWSDQAQASLTGDVSAAYQTALAVRQLRLMRGERPQGFKIGFTNRNIWPVYGVFGPIWGTVYDSSLTLCEGATRLSLAARCQPRLEPEAVFGMRATPPMGASVNALFDCIDWVAPGFEIVQSHAANWKFTAAMTVADGGLHSHLIVGRPVKVRDIADSADAFNARFEVCNNRLYKNGALKELGQGRNVLGSPLLALHHFLVELRQCPGAPELMTGDLVTTGTWTDAWPVQAGEQWRSEFDTPLSPLSVTFD